MIGILRQYGLDSKTVLFRLWKKLICKTVRIAGYDEQSMVSHRSGLPGHAVLRYSVCMHDAEPVMQEMNVEGDHHQ